MHVMKIENLFVDNCSQETYLDKDSIRCSNPPQGKENYGVIRKNTTITDTLT